MGAGGHFELECCTLVLMNEIGSRKCTRNDVAQTYALAMRSSNATDWQKVNMAIIERWSRSALEYIKLEANKFLT